MAELPTDTKSLSRAFGLHLSPAQLERLEAYVALLEKWRSRINLIGQAGNLEILSHHFMESFWLCQQFLGDGGNYCDVGTGAGFPGLAAGAYNPQIGMTLIEPNLKRVVFLQEVNRQLALDARIHACRAEEWDTWEDFDIVMSRALKPSIQVLHSLEAVEVPLLYLHGAHLPQNLARLRVLRSEKVPLSDRRYATLFGF